MSLSARDILSSPWPSPASHRRAELGLVTVTALHARVAELRIGLSSILSFRLVLPCGAFIATNSPTALQLALSSTVPRRWAAARTCPCIDARALALGVPSKRHLWDHGVAVLPQHVLGLALTG